MTVSRSIHASANDPISFLFMAEYEALLSTVFMSKEIRETLEVIGLSGQFKMKSINRNTLGDRL